MISKPRLIALATCILLVTTIAKAQDTTEEITSRFFETYATRPMEAVEYVFSTNRWMIERNKDGIESVKNQLGDFLELVGDYYGFEKITEKRVGESMKLVSFMAKYDRQPIRFTFIFYKPKDKW